MRFTRPLLLALLAFPFLLTVKTSAQTSFLEDSGEDEVEFFVMLDSYVRYGGDIKVIDGFTGETYHRGHEVVKEVHFTFPKIMGGLHRLLLSYEVEHMNYQVKLGAQKEPMLVELLDSFGYKSFKMDRNSWMTREQSILQRLMHEPFFKVEELVIWEEEKLAKGLPDNKNARNVRFDEETQSWQRRVLTHWKVKERRGDNYIDVEKFQGLNLETNKGFHLIDRGLPSQISPHAFKEVQVSYPLIVNDRENAEEQTKRLQSLVFKNFGHLYDPFTWVARRNVRFQWAYTENLRRHINQKGSRFRDRQWFTPTIAYLVDDVATVQLEGLEQVYTNFLMGRFENSPNSLGEDIDLLNWHEDEHREGKGSNKNGKIWIDFENADGARFVLLDMYLRYGDSFLDTLRTELAAVTKRQDAKPIIRNVIETVSGVSADKYISASIKAQRLGIEDLWQRMKEAKQQE